MVPRTGYLLSQVPCCKQADGVERCAELMLCEGRRFGAAQGAVCVRVEPEHGDLEGRPVVAAR
jgi:hypothetical protein